MTAINALTQAVTELRAVLQERHAGEVRASVSTRRRPE
jgi:hypothetical protein